MAVGVPINQHKSCVAKRIRKRVRGNRKLFTFPSRVTSKGKMSCQFVADWTKKTARPSLFLPKSYGNVSESLAKRTVMRWKKRLFPTT